MLLHDLVCSRLEHLVKDFNFSWVVWWATAIRILISYRPDSFENTESEDDDDDDDEPGAAEEESDGNTLTETWVK